jgi:multidrug efflux pump subunit AcrA (membrane-fusion protein)
MCAWWASVQADETRIRTVASRLEGFVERLYVGFTGQPVRAGATLLELYAPMAVAAQQDLLLARRLEREVANGTDDARSAARSAVEAARQRLAPVGGTGRRLGRGRTERRSDPHRAGALAIRRFVLEKSVQLGQRVMAGDPLYRIADLSVVWLEGEVFEQDLPLLRVGTEVIATFQALPGVQRTGRISYVYPTLNPDTRTARVRVELPNRDMSLKPGMYATLRFTGESARGLSVPRSAVLATGTRNLVFLKGRGTRFEPREVIVGVSADDRVQVLHGLAAGDTVVSSATFLIDASPISEACSAAWATCPAWTWARPHRRTPTRCRACQGWTTRSTRRDSHASTTDRLVHAQWLPGGARRDGVLVAGALALRATPLEALPDLSDVQVIVSPSTASRRLASSRTRSHIRSRPRCSRCPGRVRSAATRSSACRSCT